MDILLTGSVAYDYLMTFPGLFKEHILPERLASISLSFLVDSMTKQRGGVAPNIAYTMALLGAHPRVMATVGEDFTEYRTWLEAKGVDTSLMQVIPGLFTASFFATTDQSSAQIATLLPRCHGRGCHPIVESPRLHAGPGGGFTQRARRDDEIHRRKPRIGNKIPVRPQPAGASSGRSRNWHAIWKVHTSSSAMTMNSGSSPKRPAGI